MSGIPDTVSPEGCAWRFIKGPDKADPYEGSNWTLVKRPGKGHCDKPALPADPNHVSCPGTPAPQPQKPPHSVRFANSDLEKRIAYFKKCSKIVVSRKLGNPDFKAMTIPDKVSPRGCAWRFYSGPDPASPYEGSNWRLVQNGTDTNCPIAEIDSDLGYQICPPGSSGSPDSSGHTPGPNGQTQQERERQEREREERERQEREKEERERQEREKEEERLKRERLERNTLEKERAEKERLQKEKEERLERERQERVKQRLAKVPGHKDEEEDNDNVPGPEDQSPSEDDDPTSNVPMGREEVSLSGRSFFINYDKSARARRKAAFTGTGSSKLTGDEEELLETVGIVDETRDSLKTYLPDFFNALPSCQNTTAMMTSRKCEIAYYVMWSVLLKARQDVQRKIDDARVANLPDREIYQLEARLNAISNIKGDGSNPDKAAVAAVGNLAKQSHDEHAEIETVLKRIDGKIDVIKTNVDVLKGRH